MEHAPANNKEKGQPAKNKPPAKDHSEQAIGA
jgi:hypothetical protein